MRKTVVFFIDLYRGLFGGIINQILGTTKLCRYELSCSRYAKAKILEKGVLKGSILAIRRLLSCSSFGRIKK